MGRVYLLDNIQQFAAINVQSDPGYIPGPKIIPGCAMVRLNWNLPNGKIGHNILYCTYNGTPALTNALAQTIFAGITSGVNWTPLVAFLAPTVSLAGVTLLDVRSNSGVEFNSTGSSVPGTSSGTALPDEVAACITIRTNLRGPSGRGRYYIPGLATNAMATGGVIAPAAVTALTNWASNGVAGQLASNIGAQVLGLPARAGYTSPLTGRVFPPRAATTVPITGASCKDNHWDSQRRRGLK
jgi:hypothetical protein